MRTWGVRIPIVAVTACSLSEDHDKCLRVGMDDFLSKPVDKDVLAEVLRRYVAGNSSGSVSGSGSGGGSGTDSVQDSEGAGGAT